MPKVILGKQMFQVDLVFASSWCGSGAGGIIALTVQMLSTQKLAKVRKPPAPSKVILNLMFGGEMKKVSHMHKNTLWDGGDKLYQYLRS